MQTVWITGGSRGVGRALCLKFAKEGWNVITCASKSRAELDLVEREISSRGVACYASICDVKDAEALEDFYKLAVSRVGQAKVLINNAGIADFKMVTDLSPQRWREVIETDLSSAFYCSRLVVPAMIEAKQGNIINISSIWGRVGASCEVAYSAAKSGLAGFTKGLARELGPSGIRVNGLELGYIDTAMNAGVSKEVEEDICKEIALCRKGTPEELADFVYDVVLKTDYLTGQMIGFDGGWM